MVECLRRGRWSRDSNVVLAVELITGSGGLNAAARGELSETRFLVFREGAWALGTGAWAGFAHHEVCAGGAMTGRGGRKGRGEREGRKRERRHW